ncbi:hypothetical protein LEN26_004120 [Aphanomyces euteiches]|uniref:HTH CENPB-type domain-containing protein n=2 Tax=Aphanomyces euteiches TaxID=100861 RepID=A0A6G0WZX2_9STRA|nr:hypothetical protein Ae201684_009883 [Aphanomyces euteiches]KAH9096061.1 hypothetical protein Ae201684P_010264 [Aphanomyces euteiches]KAH9114935.1 hypothetical protein AeMF1_011009 [Aphanomyces euteiches]KAH9143928.1 hypothetical protein AeRB84_012112 [Aphanomyces euteiches]KAH9150057.1 hypothetical protein LEN26_004120 [Aphanomyces euteiches]
MTAAQKAKIQTHVKENPTMTLEQLCAWAFKTLRLPTMPSISAMSRAMKKEIDQDVLAARPNIKVVKPVASERLESEMYEWMQSCDANGVKVTYEEIRQQAIKLSASYDTTVNLRFSHGWICKFLARYKMHVKGEAKKRRMQAKAQSKAKKE